MVHQRASTGCQGLDEILCGGLLPASSTLVVGGPGTGKTVLTLQCLSAAAGRGLRCLYITLAEPRSRLLENAAAFEWTLAAVVIEDLTDLVTTAGGEGEYTVFEPSEVEQVPVWDAIYRSIDDHDPEIVAIDSATFLAYLSTDRYQYRKQVQRLVNDLSARRCVSLLLFEQDELRQDTSIALAVDCVISLRNRVSPGQMVELRSLEISKRRGASYRSGHHAFRITDAGMTVFPRRVETLESHPFDGGLLTTGIPEMDALLAGGLPRGTVTLITGPSGAGKSTLGTQLLLQAADRGTRSVLYTFEEGRSSYLHRCQALGMPLAERVADGMVCIREINPLDLYPDEFLHLVRADLAAREEALIMIDSLRGYNQAMEEFGNLVANARNLLTHARSQRASVLVVNELEQLTGDLRITDVGASTLCDNVLMLRYAEHDGELIKVVGCLKMRLGDFQPELRRLHLTSAGIQVGPKLRHLRGLLTGVPDSAPPPPGTGGAPPD